MVIRSVNTVPQFQTDPRSQNFLTVNDTKFLDTVMKIITGVVILKTVPFTFLYNMFR